MKFSGGGIFYGSSRVCSGVSHIAKALTMLGNYDIFTSYIDNNLHL